MEEKMEEKRYAAIEIPLADGGVSMYLGELVSRTSEEIVLLHPCFVKDTGRRHKFFGGTPDSNAEWEPSGEKATFPSQGVIVTEWPFTFEPFLSAH
jgi:hypothetical protein